MTKVLVEIIAALHPGFPHAVDDTPVTFEACRVVSLGQVATLPETLQDLEELNGGKFPPALRFFGVEVAASEVPRPSAPLLKGIGRYEKGNRIGFHIEIPPNEAAGRWWIFRRIVQGKLAGSE